MIQANLDRTANRGQGRTQFVGGVGQEIAVLRYERREPIEHAVDRLRKLIDLIARAANRQTFLEVRRLQMRGRLDDLCDRPRGAPGNDVATHRRQEDEENAGEENIAIDQIDVFLQRQLQKTATEIDDLAGRVLQSLFQNAMPAAVERPLNCVKKGCESVRGIGAAPDERLLVVENLQEETAVFVVLGLIFE